MTIQLTRRQHFISAASLRRFADTDECVDVVDLKRNRPARRTSPKDGIFFQHAWDQRAEDAYHDSEGAFDALAKQLVAGELSDLQSNHQALVSEIHALWRVRHRLATQPVQDARLVGISADYERNPDRERALEAGYVQFLRGDVLPGRQLAGMLTQIGIDQLMLDPSDGRWSVWRAGAGEFLAPDTFGTVPWVSVSPQLLLIFGSGPRTLGASEVAEVNQVARAQAQRLLFARRLAHCPERA